jgi:hypothetical protein
VERRQYVTKLNRSRIDKSKREECCTRRSTYVFLKWNFIHVSNREKEREKKKKKAYEKKQ